MLVARRQSATGLGLRLKPPPWKGVPRGCLQERAGTRHFSQLASSSRGSDCSSGNALPLAENAFMGVCAIEQFPFVQLVPLMDREQSWRLARCGRFGVNGVRVWRAVTLRQTWVVIFFLHGGFLTTPKSAGSMASATTVAIWLGPNPNSGPTGRCPMKPNTPLGPDQVNVLLL
jgi:hypothetical protein